MLKAEIRDGNMIITIPMGTPTPSTSGKTLVVASTRGNYKTDLEVDGKKVVIGLNAYVAK